MTSQSQYFYIGSYTNHKSQGIYEYALLPDGSLKFLGLVAKTDNPSFLTISTDRKYLLAVNENDPGYVEAFQIEGNNLIQLSKSLSGGSDPCFITINENGYILVANYTGGSIGLLKIDEEDKLVKLLDVCQSKGNFISERQNAAHAHSAWFVPNSNDIISLDLGTNKLYFSYIDYKSNKLIPHQQANLKMKAGAGPRHLAFHPSNKKIYVLNELNSSITIISKNKLKEYIIEKSYSTLPSDYQGANLCAEIKISNDGKFLYASNRGHDSIVIFSISENGILQKIAYQSSHIKEPRNFALSPDNQFLLVANQSADTIVSFKRNSTSGLLQFTNKAKAYTPVHILFA